MQIADKTKSSLVSEGPVVRETHQGPMFGALKADTLYVRFTKRPDMTERLLTDA